MTIGFAVGVGYDEGDLPDDLRDKDEGRGSDSPYCVWDPAGAIAWSGQKRKDAFRAAEAFAGPGAAVFERRGAQ